MACHSPAPLAGLRSSANHQVTGGPSGLPHIQGDGWGCPDKSPSGWVAFHSLLASEGSLGRPSLLRLRSAAPLELEAPQRIIPSREVGIKRAACDKLHQRHLQAGGILCEVAGGYGGQSAWFPHSTPLALAGGTHFRFSTWALQTGQF